MSVETRDTALGMRGKVRRNFLANEAPANEVAGWFYMTPRFPTGIARTALARADEVTHHEVARSWFMANLRPINPNETRLVALSPGLSALEAASGLFLATEQVPQPVDTLQVLKHEFDGAIPEGAVRAVATWLGDWWEWLPPSGAERLAPDDLRAAALSKLDTLTELLRRLMPQAGEAGHNLPDDDLPISRAEHAEALEAIGQVKAALTANPPATRRQILAPWEPVKTALAKIWTWAQARQWLPPGFMEAAGPILGAGAAGIGLCVTAHHLGVDIDTLIELIVATKVPRRHPPGISKASKAPPKKPRKQRGP